MNKSQMRNIARKCRKELELIKNEICVGVPLHFIGLCGYGSVLLFSALRNRGLDPTIASGRGHWFVICNNILLDITASQFGQSKIVVRNYSKIEKDIASGGYHRPWWRVWKEDKDLLDAGLYRHRAELKKYIDLEKL